MSRPPSTEPKVRIFAPVFILGLVIGGGALGLYAVGRGRWSIAETAYVAVNAVSTVGFHEPEGASAVQYARLVMVGTILAGLGADAYFQSSLTALLVQGVIGHSFRRRRMQARIDSLDGHVIVTGAGSTGVHAIEELVATRTPLVVIDRSRDMLERISRELTKGSMLYVVGDATDDAVLVQAGVTRARGVIAALTEDKDNLFVTLSARSLNAKARIVSKVIAPETAPKMIRAGANATVSPNMMGGRRLASELVRPAVTEFIDQMLREKDEALRFEEVVIPVGSGFVGRSLREVPIRAETKLLVVALRVDKKFLYNPEPSSVIDAGTVLIVLGETGNVARLREMVRTSIPQ